MSRGAGGRWADPAAGARARIVSASKNGDRDKATLGARRSRLPTGEQVSHPAPMAGRLHLGSCREGKYYLVLFMTRRPLQRISMTIPGDVLRQADLLARQWSRSRSWVISEAIRQLGAKPGASPVEHLVAEPAAPAYATMAIAEARAVRRRPTRRQVIGFDSLEDFAQWNKARRAGA